MCIICDISLSVGYLIDTQSFSISMCVHCMGRYFAERETGKLSCGDVRKRAAAVGLVMVASIKSVSQAIICGIHLR